MTINYTQLKSSIQNWAENDSTELSDELDRIIKRAELRIYRDIDLDVARRYATTNLSAGNPFVVKPNNIVVDRWMHILDTATGDHEPLLQKDVAFVYEYWPDRDDTGFPKYYASWDHDSFVIAPTPDSSYQITLAYTVRPTVLSSANATTWLSVNAEDVLLNACMLEVGKFLRWEQLDRQHWEEEYQRSAKQLKREAESRERHDESRYGERR